MTENGNDLNSLINKAIKASIEFEELMEKIDFKSWFEKIDKDEKIEVDTEEKLHSECDKQAFLQYSQWVEDAVKMCENFINPDYEKWLFNENKNKEQFVKSLIHYLFMAKLNRLKARRTSTLKVESNKYIEGANILNVALNNISLGCLQKPLKDNGQRKKDYDLLMILFYNDLSICYAGLKNSYMSRGYAEESINLIKEDEDYKKFEQEIDDIESKIDSKKAKEKDYEKLKDLQFVPKKSKKYYLYTFALFCKAVAESRSFLKEDAEKTFMQIINFGDKFRLKKKSDYFSALVNVASLLIDLSRGKEAIQMLEKVKPIDKMDRRWAECLLEKASALIDQSSYKKARKTLNELHNFEKNEIEERFAEPVLSGLIYYGRSYLEEARNVLSCKKENREEESRRKESNITEAIKKLKKAYEVSEKREQKILMQKAAKYIAEAYQEDENTTNSLKYYSRSISEGAVIDFSNLLKSDWKIFVNNCEDVDILDNFSKQISAFLSDSPKKYKNSHDLCFSLLDKLKKECEDNGNLVLSEQAERRKEELELIQQGAEGGIPETLKGEKYETNFKILTGVKSIDKKQKDNSFLTGIQMLARLDSNEEIFDKALYGRTAK